MTNHNQLVGAEPPIYVNLPDERKLEVRTAGPEDGEILLFHHGTPGVGMQFPPLAKAAAAKGLRTVMYSRPGYGTSTPQPGRKVIDAAADVPPVENLWRYTKMGFDLVGFSEPLVVLRAYGLDGDRLSRRQGPGMRKTHLFHVSLPAIPYERNPRNHAVHPQLPIENGRRQCQVDDGQIGWFNYPRYCFYDIE